MTLILHLQPAEGNTAHRPARNARPSREALEELAAASERRVLACAEQVRTIARHLGEAVRVQEIPRLELVLLTCREEAAAKLRQVILETCPEVAGVAADAETALID
jgi:hypothetical protein